MMELRNPEILNEIVTGNCCKKYEKQQVFIIGDVEVQKCDPRQA